MTRPIATLELADGTRFEGTPFGAARGATGEVVFNTGMVGYPESLTDPSYRGQILVLTYPLVGNYGVPGPERVDGLLRHFESERIQVEALVVAEWTRHPDHHQSTRTLDEWLADEGIPGLAGVDTRQLARRLREVGTLPGRLTMPGMDPPPDPDPHRHLVSEVSLPEPVVHARGRTAVALVDCGVKTNILRALLLRDLTVIRCPWDTDFTRLQVAGAVLSNGPGDPTACGPTIEHTRRAMAAGLPLLGICLGSQIMGLAAGAKTYKLPFGHRGPNQPCRETGTRRCHITSQNHGYAVDARTLPEDWREWFTNANDDSNEGIFHIARPFFGAQFHPEAAPGPDDTDFLFDLFARALQ